MKQTLSLDSRPVVVDLFSGVGGFSLGASRAGFRVGLAAEIDARCITAHSVNFPGSGHLQADVSKLRARDILEAGNLLAGQIDGVIGGPPCQGFSSIGKNAEGDVRNELVGHFFRLVEELSPRFFVMENVPGIISARHEDFLRPMLQAIGRKYRLVGPLLVKASDFGAPTIRTRAFIFGFDDSLFRNSICESDLLRGKNAPNVTVEHALKGLPRKLRDSLFRKAAPGEVRWTSAASPHFEDHLIGRIPDGVGDPASIEKLHLLRRVTGMLPTAHSEEVRARYAQLKGGETDRVTKSMKLFGKGFCPTLRAGTGPERGSFQAVRPIHHLEPRVITPREGARLQGFPDWFQFHETIWHSFRMIGNSVSPIVAETILSPIAEALYGGSPGKGTARKSALLAEV